MSETTLIAGRSLSSRRSFLGNSTVALAAGVCGSLVAAQPAQAETTEMNVLGPRPGYSPQVGTFVSMLTWMRDANGVLAATKGLTQTDLDVLFDKDANTIGALMLHLAATETYYAMNTFEGKKWNSWSDAVKQQWDAAMDLGDAGRKAIKGHDREYYVNVLHETREKSLAEFRKRDDAWLLAVDKDWPWGPTNNLCKWFHVCEHEAHHSGQIAMLRKRLPGAKPDAG
ncbi:MAG: DinB family protein [Terracidiphilus sp.]